MAADSSAKRRIDYAVKLMRYKRAVEQRRMPANRKRLAVQHYAEVQVLLSKWLARGLTQSVLEAIRNEVYSIPAPAGP